MSRVGQLTAKWRDGVRRTGGVFHLVVLVLILLLAAACGDARDQGPSGADASVRIATSTGESAPTGQSEGSESKGPSSVQPGLESSMRFERISREEGLSQGTIACIFQDSLGFMWFCTEDGLNRYDGYDFTVYRHDPDDPGSMGPGEIWSIYEDQEGMLWVWKYRGSFDRYDRNTDRFIRYDLYDAPDPESPSIDFVWAMYEDSGGTLWLGTYRSGLQRYDRDEDRFIQYRHDPDDPHSISSDRVYSIYEDDAGVLWVATMEGLNRLDRVTGHFARFQHDPEDPQTIGADIVQHAFEDRADRFWVATFAIGLEQFDRQTGKVVARYEHDPDDPTSIDATDRISEVYEDQQGFLWIVHFDRRLDRFDPELGTFRRYRHDPGDPSSLSAGAVTFISEDRAGNLWVGTASGLDRYNPATDDFTHYRHDPSDPHSLSSNGLTAFYEDQSGVLWIGTGGNGLNFYDPARTKFAHYLLEVPEVDPENNNAVNAILEDRTGLIWIGTFAGLNRLDPTTGQITYFGHDPLDPDSLGPGSVSAIYEDLDGRLWIGTDSGLHELDRSTGRFVHYDQVSPANLTLSIGAVRSILQDRSGVLWLARHREGLCEFDRDKGSCTMYAYNPEDSLNPQDMLRPLYEDRAGNLWAGSAGGLLIFDRRAKTFALYEHDPENPKSLSNNDVRCIYEDRAGRLWVATNGGGINRLDRSEGTFVRYTDNQGLPSNIVQGIVEDAQGNLWLGTSNGLSKFDPLEGSFRNYDTGDGLQSEEFLYGASYQDANGEIYFGGMNGFNVFQPEEVRDHSYIPPVVLTSLSQGGVEVEAGKAVERITEATFRWPNNFFEFEFAALSYSQPEKNQYAYMLEGFRDEAWNYIGTKRFGRYTNLPGGTYTLKLKGSNSDGIWNEEGAALSITVVPPFWETWWFRGLVIALLVLVLLVVYWQRSRGIRARSEELERQVADRTKELAALNAISAVVSRSLDRQQILDDALDMTLEVTGLEAGGIYLLHDGASIDGGKGVLKIAAHRGLSAALVEGIDNLVVGEGFSGRVVQTGEPLVVGDLATDPRLTRSVVRESGFRFVAIAPLVSRAAAYGTLFVMTRGETELIGQDVELLSSVGVQIGVAIENARLFAAEQRRAEQFRLINQVGQELTLIYDLNEVLAEVTRMIQEAFGYYHVGIGMVEGDAVVYRLGAGELWDDPSFEFRPARLKLGEEGLSGWVAASGEPLLIPDVSKDPRYVWMRRSRTRSELTVPIMVKGEVIGVLDVQSDRLNAFDDTDLAVLQSLAHQVGSAVENVMLYEQGQRTAVMEERNRLARDLHDAVTQTLFSASLIAEAVPVSWESDQEEGRQLLSELQHLTRGALAEMRTLLLELRPAALAETSLGDLLRQLAEAATGRAGLPVEVSISGDCLVPPDVHVALYRISQEALNNVAKHARASHAKVHLRCTPAPAGGWCAVELEIRDDGRGFDPEAVGPDHLGLGIMRERAQAIGAHLQVETEVGHGTHVTLSWAEVDRKGEVVGS